MYIKVSTLAMSGTNGTSGLGVHARYRSDFRTRGLTFGPVVLINKSLTFVPWDTLFPSPCCEVWGVFRDHPGKCGTRSSQNQIGQHYFLISISIRNCESEIGCASLCITCSTQPLAHHPISYRKPNHKHSPQPWLKPQRSVILSYGNRDDRYKDCKDSILS